MNPPQPELVLVDHNELSQAVQGAEEADIVEVLDHHRLGGSLKSNHPIRFYMEPVGSTCTLVARMFQNARIGANAGNRSLHGVRNDQRYALSAFADGD